MRYRKNTYWSFLVKIIGISKAVKLANWFYRLISRLKSKRTEFNLSGSLFDWDKISMVYISQPPRMGGTLLRSLFDGTEQVFVHPHELSIEPNIGGWSVNHSLDDFKDIFWKLRDPWIDYCIVKGLNGIPFNFNNLALETIYVNNKSLSLNPIKRYLESFYYATNLNSKEFVEKIYLSFTPWNLDDLNSINQFYELFPNGYRIQVVRDLDGWWNSEYNYDDERKDLEKLFIERWLRPITVGIEAKEKFGDKYIIIRYVDLVKDRQNLMYRLCKILGIEYSESLQMPTNFGYPLEPNTSTRYGSFQDVSANLPLEIKEKASNVLIELERLFL